MESSFQQIVLTFAIIFLIVILVVIGYSLSNSKTNKKWPPIIGNCPDYWEDITDGTVTDGSIKCKNTQSMGNCGATKTFLKTDTPCIKYTWATSCGVAWDGITYGHGQYKPCETKPPSSAPQ
jgi:hypothetical protein